MPLLYTCHTPLMGVWKIKEPWQDMLAALPDSLRPDKLWLDNTSSDKCKQERLAARLLLRQLLNAATPAGRDIRVVYEPDGAPYLSNCPYHIGISHTKGFAAVIIDECPYPGIDVEYHSGRAWKLRERFMNAAELQLFDRLPDDTYKNGEREREPNMLCTRELLAELCWCAKETAFKAMRQSEVDFAGHLRILPFDLPQTPPISPALHAPAQALPAPSTGGVLMLKETKTPEQNIFAIHYCITADFLLTWTC